MGKGTKDNIQEQEIIEGDILDEIFVDKNEPADKKLIVEILKSFATIDSKGVINFTDNYDKLKESKKVLVFMVCKKAMMLKGLPEILEKTNVKEIIEKAGVSKSTAKNVLFTNFKKIIKEGLIPNYNLRKIKDIVLQNE